VATEPVAWTVSTLEARLRARIDAGLPGLQAQLRMAPRPRPGWQPYAWPAGTRRAAALLLMFPDGPDAAIVLTVRSRALPTHAGQVSLPGGAVEPGEPLEVAALREAHEEIGLDPRLVEIVGPLTPLHIPVSGFALHPIVGASRDRPRFIPHAGEVERVLVVRVADLVDPGRLHRSLRVRDGHSYDVPAFDVAGEQVWGATAMILAEFLWAIGKPLDPWGDGAPA
jgi:8-oxo-dGTP pyrophosphatase MutT (NUDIX family)